LSILILASVLGCTLLSFKQQHVSCLLQHVQQYGTHSQLTLNVAATYHKCHLRNRAAYCRDVTLQRRKKYGLLAAVNNLSSELMLLSVATLFLTALAPAITTICMPTGNTMKPWLANVEGCACCLAKTKGVTPCFVQVSATCWQQLHCSPAPLLGPRAFADADGAVCW
jgi:hypothetical protein